MLAFSKIKSWNILNTMGTIVTMVPMVFILLIINLFGSSSVFAENVIEKPLPYIHVNPENPIQGEPVMISVSGATLDQVAKILWNGRSLWFFNYQNQPTVIVELDLNYKVGNQVIKIILENGQIITKDFTIGTREKIEAPLGIPNKLGGDTPQAATNLVSNLTKENISQQCVFSKETFLV